MSTQGGGRRNSVATLQGLRDTGERFALITAYDRATAELAEAAEIPAILVGDSLAQVALGHESTVRIGMSEMLHHVAAVVRSSRSALVIADMPFLSYVDVSTAAANASAFLRDAGAGAVKLEGGTEVAPIVRALVDSGVPVIGHIGFTPQSALQQDRARAQGKEPAAAAELLADALAVQAAGAAAIVIELVPTELAALITERLTIPTIGIG
ncbi:MAG: 3-methyl-2-oxobutanoate hydroxymethyltransferase, partial [Candidatus Limnocylindrus sp.]